MPAGPSSDTTVTRSTREWLPELAGFLVNCRQAVLAVVAANEAFSVVSYQAEWHLRGVVHHMRRMLEAYDSFAREVGIRAQVEPPLDVLVMYSPSFQELLFELYALVNLSRITLDNLRFYLRPVFKTDFRQMPKSLSDFIRGSTDCPVYKNLAGQEAVEYLRDLRNCLVHYRTLAVGDNALVLGDHVSGPEEKALLRENRWFDHMARARFRRVPNGVVVNVFLPDRIFDHSDRGDKLVEFTYERRCHLLSQGMVFTRLVADSLASTFALLLDPGQPTFVYARSSQS
jgi:hypothetical protein